MLDLTIAIPAKNEKGKLPGCLSTIGSDFARSVVLIDSFSTDGTVEIARQNNIPVVQFDWNGRFPKKRNWFLRTHTPETAWVLFLDADEHLTEAFKAELRSKLPTSSAAGFWLNYSIYFLGQPLKGGYPLRKLALFRVGAGAYERIDEDRWSHLDMEIHEHPVIDGSISEIKSRIDHRDDRGVEAWTKKHAEYASWEAKRYCQKLADKTQRSKWTWKQKFKFRLMGTPWIAPAFFFGCFFLMAGFRDGRRGFTWACLKAGYFAQVYARIQEEKLKPKESTENTAGILGD